MLRRILIIVLVAVVIIVAFFAIRSFLNRDSDQTDVSDPAETAVVIEEADTASEESPIEDVVVEETVVDTVDNAPEETSTDGYPEPVDNTGDEVSVSPEGSDAEVVVEAGVGGDVNSGDPNAGGGVPAEGAEAASDEAAPALGDAVAVEPGDTVAVEPDAGTGGAQTSPPVAFVQPGVPTQHTAANQEWLTQLARCYGTTVADIQAANNYACPDLIHPGYVVNISNPGNAGPITINDQPCFVNYTVQQGDTLYSIASMYGIDYQWLARINAIYNYNYVYAGQQLVIPNPVDAVFTTPPAQPYFYSNCWYNYCPGWQYPPVAVPYGY